MSVFVGPLLPVALEAPCLDFVGLGTSPANERAVFRDVGSLRLGLGLGLVYTPASGGGALVNTLGDSLGSGRSSPPLAQLS